MQRGEIRNPVMVLVLSMVTCGIYGLIWLFQVGGEINRGLGREEFNMVKELLLSVVTCGLWGIWFQWRFCEAVVRVEQSWGLKPQMDAPILFILSLVGLGPFFIQQSLNQAWQHGNPGPGAGSY